jgi:Transposase
MVKRGPWSRPQASEKAQHGEHFAGLDVSVKETSVCIVDDTGKIVREVEGSKRARSSAASTSLSGSDWKLGLYRNGFLVRLAEAGLPVICVETRHTCGRCCRRRINKIDQNDARGITQMMRVGLYRPVHVKTLRGQKLRMLLTHRKLIQSKAIAIDNDLRGTLRNFMLVRTNQVVMAQGLAIKIARHLGMKKAIVALARRLAVIMHRIWLDGTEFRWTRELAVP